MNIGLHQFGRWFPDADEVNAPEGTLLRADNVVPDSEGAASLRQGSTKLDSALVGGAVHSLFSATINGVNYRFAGVGNRLYVDGADSGLVFDGTGDFAYGTDAYQVFVARGQTRKKFDGSQWHNWHIPPPSEAPTLTAASAVTTEVAKFNSAESPAFTVTEGTRSFVTDQAGTGSGASQMTVSAAGRSSLFKKWPSDQDFLDVGGTIGSDTDIFDMYTALSDWDRTISVTVMFGLNTGTDPFLDDYYSFEWNLQRDEKVNLQEPAAAVVSAVQAAAADIAQVVSPENIIKPLSPSEIVKLRGSAGQYGVRRSLIRRDAEHSSPAWFHLSVTRGQFTRTGSTSGRDWKTVRGFKVMVKTAAGGTYTATFSNTIWYAGGSRALTGTYKALVVAVRKTDHYTELSPVSPVSAPITLNQNGLNVSISAATRSGLDPQVTGFWIYLFSPNIGGWYRYAVTGGLTSLGMTPDEITVPAGSDLDTQSERIRVNLWGMSGPVGATTDLVVTIRKSDVEALRDGVRLVPYLTSTPENIVAVAGPWNSRMFTLTSDGWLYVSAQSSPSHFNGLHVLDLRRYGTPHWVVQTNGGVYVGMSSDVIRVGGTGDEDENLNTDIFPEPLGVGNPPVDKAVYTDGSAIVYRAADGLMTLSGVTSAPVSSTGVSLLWRGVSRHGVSALNTSTGRFRLSVDNHVLYMIAPEGTTVAGSGFLWKYDTVRQWWYRSVYPTLFHSLHRDVEGRMLAGDGSGNVWLLENSAQDDGTDIDVTIWTPHLAGSGPFKQKTAHDLLVEVDTGGRVLTVSPFLDGSSTAATTWAVNTALPSTYRRAVYGLPDFSRVHLELTGSFSRLFLRGLMLSVRDHPQQRMSVDSGYINPVGSADIAWIEEVELNARSGVDLEVVPIFDDIEQDPLPVVVSPNRYTVYRVPLKRRQNKGRRPRILVRTTAQAGAAGFELEWMRVRMRGSGNEVERTITVLPEAL